MNTITELIARLRSFAKLGEAMEKAIGQEKGDLTKILFEAADTIEELSAKLTTSNEWIPVEERLPENDKPVLVTVDWDHDDLEVCTAEYWHDGDCWGNLEDYITAWRPLPEPFRGKTGKERKGNG